MPRGGAVTLSDVREPALVIVCEPCERGRFKVERLMAEQGRQAHRFADDTGRLPQGALDERPRPMQGGVRPSDAMVVGSNSYADRNAGVVRVYADRDRGVIKGACLFGPGMDHIAHLFAWAIERSETASALLQLPFYHPMFEEGLKTALREICEAVGSPELKDMDFVAAPGA